MPQYAKIDVSKIDKNRLFHGKKGVYLDLILIETPNNPNGSHIIKQNISKAERDSGVEMPILGNILRPKDGKPVTSRDEVKNRLQPARDAAAAAASDDVPF